MASWGDILSELGSVPSQTDVIRRKYIHELSEYTGRNTIAYYSSFLTKRVDNVDINDNDMNGFMNAMKGLDWTKGLDLILHTPGGSPAAAEAIIEYIRSKFNNNFRVIVPQIAMSAGTMMACAGSEIIMGNHSSLGPIDPQFNGIPAYNIVEEFNEAKDELKKDPSNAPYWAIKLQQFPAAFLKSAMDAIDLATELVQKWLASNMFGEEKNSASVQTITNALNEHKKSKIHGRHFNIEYCKSIGLKIHPLEENNEFQDKVLSVHHAYMICLDRTTTTKIIENQDGHAVIISARV